MFTHGYHNYMEHAFPHDELKPITCSGHDTLGGYALTVVDALDTLFVRSRFFSCRRFHCPCLRLALFLLLYLFSRFLSTEW